MAFLKESQGHLGDLTEKSRIELVDLLGRQERLLQNKKFINSLKDKGKKIQDFMIELKRILAEKDEIDDAVTLFEGMSLRQSEMDVDTGDKGPERKDVRLIEKMEQLKAKKGPTIQEKKGPFKPFSTLRSDVTKLIEKQCDVADDEAQTSNQTDVMVTSDSETISDALGRVTDELFKEYESRVAPFTSPPVQELVSSDPAREYKFVTFDIKTNSNGSDAEICQISAVSAEGDSFSEYSLPAYLSRAAAKVTGLTVEYEEGKRILRKNGQTLEAHSRQVVLKHFVEYVTKLKTNNSGAMIVLVGTTSMAQRRTLLYNLRTFSIPVPDVCFANFVPLLRCLQTCGKIRVDTCDLESVFYSLYNYKLDSSDSLIVAQAVHKVLNDSRLQLTSDSVVNGIECVSCDYGKADLDFLTAKRQRLTSLRGKMFDSTVSSHDVITADLAKKIAASGLNYSDLETLYNLGQDVFICVLARPPTSCPGWGSRVSDSADVLLRIYNHFVRKNR
ncbi:uncharacterized protein LOC135483738 isoform X2 [Lineus longissimus]